MLLLDFSGFRPGIVDPETGQPDGGDGGGGIGGVQPDRGDLPDKIV